jgi:hypothetical protein
MKHSTLKSITLVTLAVLFMLLTASCSAPHQHAYGEWTVDGEVNCIDGTTEKRSCDCGAVETRTVPGKGHNFIDGVCSNCGRGPSEGLEFYSNGDGTCSLIKNGTCTDADIIIPARSPSGDIVTEIKAAAFYNVETLTSVYIPESVIAISTDAFWENYNLSSFNISPNNAFFTSVDGVIYNKDLTTLIRYPGGRPDTAFDIPASVTTIGIGAFAEATKIENISIPASVQTIGKSAFHSCYALTSITIPEGVTTIADYTFFACHSLSTVNLPESITTIGVSAFQQCISLINFTIPNSVTTISTNAFNNCESLTSLTVPNGVTSIPDGAFSLCISLTEIKLHDKITNIGERAFYYCKALKQITIPDGLTRIYRSTFASCASLESIVIPDSVTRIDENAFFYCESLESVIIPDGIKTIYESTFKNCFSLVSVTIPESVTNIEGSAFSECKSLSSIIFKGTVKQWESVKAVVGWRAYVPAKGVTCSDGTVEFSFSYS